MASMITGAWCLCSGGWATAVQRPHRWDWPPEAAWRLHLTGAFGWLPTPYDQPRHGHIDLDLGWAGQDGGCHHATAVWRQVASDWHQTLWQGQCVCVLSWWVDGWMWGGGVLMRVCVCVLSWWVDGWMWGGGVLMRVCVCWADGRMWGGVLLRGCVLSWWVDGWMWGGAVLMRVCVCVCWADQLMAGCEGVQYWWECVCVLSWWVCDWVEVVECWWGCVCVELMSWWLGVGWGWGGGVLMRVCVCVLRWWVSDWVEVVECWWGCVCVLSWWVSDWVEVVECWWGCVCVLSWWVSDWVEVVERCWWCVCLLAVCRRWNWLWTTVARCAPSRTCRLTPHRAASRREPPGRIPSSTSTPCCSWVVAMPTPPTRLASPRRSLTAASAMLCTMARWEMMLAEAGSVCWSWGVLVEAGGVLVEAGEYLLKLGSTCWSWGNACWSWGVLVEAGGMLVEVGKKLNLESLI